MYARTVVLSGTIYFDFEQDSSRLNALIERAVSERVNVNLGWKALTLEPVVAAESLPSMPRLLAAHEVIRDKQRQRRFRQAVFAMLHRHGDDPADPVTLRAAVKVAGMDWAVVDEAIGRTGHRLLEEIHTEAIDAGVDTTPSFVGGGPAIAIELSAAAGNGPARPKLDLIERMAREDGVWVLRKP